MKLKRIFCFTLCAAMLLSLLSGCGGEHDAPKEDVSEHADTPTTEAMTGEMPTDEYERAVWYGFAEEGALSADAQISEKQFVDLLTQVIIARSGDAAGWMTLVEGASTENLIYRDYGAMLLLYAAEHMNATDLPGGWRTNIRDRFNESSAFDSDIHGGYSLLEAHWDRICPSISALAGYEKNYLNSSQDYVVSRTSLVTGAPLLDFDYDSYTARLIEPFTCHDAAVAVVRLYESFPDVAERFSEPSETTARAMEILSEAQAKRDAIINSETTIVKADEYIPGETYSGTAYYVANDGSDSNAGTSPEKPWKTIDRVNTANLRYGDAVFFKRGDIWREVEVYSREGVTYSAYGEGAKPRLYGSPENGGDAEKWSLWHEGENGEKIWVYHKNMLDCGTVVFNGTTAARKIRPFWNGEAYQVLSPIWETYGQDGVDDQQHQPVFDPKVHLDEDMTFFSQADSHLPDTLPVYLRGWNAGEGKPLALVSTGPLLLRCDAGNPGELYGDIEFSTSHNQFDGVAAKVTIDNLALCYAGTDAVSVVSDGVVVQNCELGWGGGCVASYSWESITGYTGGVQSNGGIGGARGSNIVLRNNYLYETWQEGFGVETAVEFDQGEENNIENITISDNVLYHCAEPLMLFNWDDIENPNHQFKNIVYENNYVLFSGMSNINAPLSGFGFLSRGINMQEDSAVKNNVFLGGNSYMMGIEIYSEKYLLDYEGNTYAAFADVPVFFSKNAPIYFSPQAEAVMRDILKDETGEYLILQRHQWTDFDW